jgi:hypothetical protein
MYVQCVPFFFEVGLEMHANAAKKKVRQGPFSAKFTERNAIGSARISWTSSISQQQLSPPPALHSIWIHRTTLDSTLCTACQIKNAVDEVM